MKRIKWLSIVLAFTIAGMALIPLQGYARVSDDIQRQINEITKKQQEAERLSKEAEKRQADLKDQINEEKHSFEQLQQEIEEQGQKLDELNKQLASVNLDLQNAADQLSAAEERVESRDKMLKSRVRMMYLNGTVSYLDVLFSATSFTDFIDRFESLKTIVGNDKHILEANKADRDVIAANKVLVEKQLVEVKALVANADALKQSLMRKEKQKEVAIASMSDEQKQAAEQEGDQDQLVLDLIKQKQELRRKLEEAKQRESRTVKKSTPQFAYSGGKLAWPVPDSTRITDNFGYRIDPIKHIRKLHKGIDIGAPRGTTIVAAEDGQVILASWVNGYGNTIVIDHGNNLFTWYGHMSRIVAHEGDVVKRGEKIGEVGSTGDSTGNHLHFEVRTGDTPHNPFDYLK